MSATKSESKSNENLIRRLSDPAVAQYLGRTACLKIEILAALETGQPSLYSIAKANGVSKQYVSHIAAQAKTALGNAAVD